MRTIIILIFVFLTGCATTEMTVGPKDVIKWKSFTLLKDVKDADVTWGDFHATLGSSVANTKVLESTMRMLDAQNLLNQCEADFSNYVESRN